MAASPTASASGSVAAAAAAAASEANDGPVLCVVSKRIRALRKKQNRILQMEEAVAAGKTLNREQEKVLRSKPVVAALIDELERLRSPLSSALAEELSAHPATAPPASSSSDSDSSTQDLLALVYFGSLFDVKPHSDYVATMVARTHERNCCITYDYVGDDAADLLMESDLDAVASLAALAAARPAAAADVSHRDALQSCVHHARQWLARTNEPIHPDSSVTYATVRAKLDRIMASDYYTAQAKITAPGDMSADSGSYGVGGVQAQDSMAVSSDAPVLEENLAAEGQKDELEDSLATEINTDHQSNAVDGQNLLQDDEAPVNPSEECPSADAQQDKFEDVAEQGQGNAESEDQQFNNPRQSYHNQRGGGRGVGRRGYSNGRGGRGGRGMGGGGYQNARGGGYSGYQGGGGGGYQVGNSGYQGGGGGYQNSRGGGTGGGGYYNNNDSGYYQQRNFNNRGRGGRSGGNSFYNNQGGGQQGGGGAQSGRVELGANA